MGRADGWIDAIRAERSLAIESTAAALFAALCIILTRCTCWLMPASNVLHETVQTGDMRKNVATVLHTAHGCLSPQTAASMIPRTWQQLTPLLCILLPVSPACLLPCHLTGYPHCFSYLEHPGGPGRLASAERLCCARSDRHDQVPQQGGFAQVNAVRVSQPEPRLSLQPKP